MIFTSAPARCTLLSEAIEVVPVVTLSPRSKAHTFVEVEETMPQMYSELELPSSIVKQLYPESVSLPRKLVETGEIRGDLHSHTIHSDGEITVPDRVRGALDRGLDFLAITESVMGKVAPDVVLRVWTPADTSIRQLAQKSSCVQIWRNDVQRRGCRWVGP